MKPYPPQSPSGEKKRARHRLTKQVYDDLIQDGHSPGWSVTALTRFNATAKP
jgi:hypothetical protein